MLAYSSRKNKNRRGGGSVQQPLDYVDSEYPKPNAPAGENLLVERGGIARPMIGGFIPSVMKGVVNSGAVLGPLVAMEAKRLWNGNSTRKRRGGGKKENWAKNRQTAKNVLSQYGKPSALNVNKYAALLRKDPAAARAFLAEYQYRKQTKATRKVVRTPRTAKATTNAPRVARHIFLNELGNVIAEEPVIPGEPLRLTVNKTGRVRTKVERVRTASVSAPKSKHIFFNNEGRTIERPIPKPVTLAQPKKGILKPSTMYPETVKTAKPATVKTTRTQYLNNLATARKELSEFGNPNVTNVAQYVSMKRKGSNVSAFINNFKTRKSAVKTTKKPVGTIGEMTPLLPMREGYVPIGTTQSAKRTRKVSNAWKTFYAQAKANLSATGQRAKAKNIAKLASIRRKGESNAEFMTAYKNKTE